MLEIKITATEIAKALNNLAEAIGLAVTTPNGTMNGATASSTTCAGADESTPEQLEVANGFVAVPVPAPTVSPTATVPAPAATVPAQAATVTSETTAAPAQAATVPTAAPQYTLEMLAKAGTALIDAGKTAELQALLQKYGVEALTALDPAQYGAVATELRAMGATI